MEPLFGGIRLRVHLDNFGGKLFSSLHFSMRVSKHMIVFIDPRICCFVTLSFDRLNS